MLKPLPAAIPRTIDAVDNNKDEKGSSIPLILKQVSGCPGSDFDFPSGNSLGPYGEVSARDLRGDLNDGDRMLLLRV